MFQLSGFYYKLRPRNAGSSSGDLETAPGVCQARETGLGVGAEGVGIQGLAFRV